VKAGSRGKGSGDGKANAPAISADDAAKQKAHEKLVEAEQRVNKGMWCSRDRRMCYITINGDHAVYTMENAKDHARLLVCAYGPCYIPY